MNLYKKVLINEPKSDVVNFSGSVRYKLDK